MDFMFYKIRDQFKKKTHWGMVERKTKNKRTKSNYGHRQKHRIQNNLLIEWFDSLDHRGENMTKQLSIRRVLCNLTKCF